MSKPKKRATVCRWTPDPDGFWHSACGLVWQFDVGSPRENGVRFCLRCGDRVTRQPEMPSAQEEVGQTREST
jgi:hypothetical protein